MKSKMVSVVLYVIIAASISTPITVNVGQQSSSSNGIVGLPLSNLSEANTQNVGQPNPNPSESENPVLSAISIPIPQIVVQSSLSLSGIGGLDDSPWPMFRHDLKHTGLSPYDTSTNPGKLKWSFTIGSWVDSSTAIGSDGTIYVGSDGHKLYAINPDGIEKWNFTTGEYITSSPAIDSDGTIYVGSTDYKLYAINPDGTEKWNFITGNHVYSSPVIGLDGTIYIGSNDKKLHAVNPDGTVKWSFMTGHYIRSSPAIGSDGTIYVGSYDNKLYAINPDGTERWSFPTGSYVQSSPAIGSDGTIYVGSGNGRLYAINPDGTEKWSFPTGDFVFSSPAIGSDGIIYVGSGDQKLYAINPDGTEKWNFTTSDEIFSSPAIGSDGSIYVGSRDSKLYAIGTLNIPPIADAGSDQTVNEGNIVEFDASASNDPDGTIETYEWDFESDGIYDYVEITNSSSDGVFDGKTTHIYGDNGIFKVTLRITDDDGLNHTDTCNITVNNIAPIVDVLPPFTTNEFESVTLTGHATDPGSDDLTFEWTWEYASWGDKTTIYYNDDIGPDPYPSPTISPRDVMEDATCQFGDDGIFKVTFTVSDDDGGSTTVLTNVTVNNVDPLVTIESTIMDVDIGLRVAGRKYNDVGMTLYEESTPIGSVSIERMPGSPDDQMAWIPITLNMTKTYSATVTFTPEDPPNIGANPVWIYIKSETGSINKIHHTFNVQQSKKRYSEHWNHVEPWKINLNTHLIGLPFEIISHITDPGSDDETITLTYSSQNVEVTHLSNPPNHDPYPSPEVNPRDIIETTTLVYEGLGTVTIVAKDDDNFRLWIGQGSDSIDII
jgi:outer membrane protein assembly factor BamB